MNGEELDAAMGTVAIGSMLSVLSVTFLIVSALALGKWRKSYWRIILALAFCDLAAAIAFICGSSPVFFFGKYLSPIPCNIQGLAVQFSLSGATYYALAIAFMLYLQVVRGFEVSPNLEVVIHLIWLPPSLTLALLPLYGADGISYTVTAGWCWVAEEPRYARFTQSYIWVWLVMLTVIILYCLILLHMRQGSMFQQQSKSVKLLLLYPLAFVIYWIPATINRSLEAFNVSIYGFVYLECLSVPLQGICNTIIYFFTSQAHTDIYHAVVSRRYATALGTERLSQVDELDEHYRRTGSRSLDAYQSVPT